MGSFDPGRLEGVRGRLDPDVGASEDPIPRDGGWLAAVAVILRDSEASPELLLIERARVERDPWSGHMAFPGGRWESEDGSLLDTAIRETREEIGIDLLGRGEVLGKLGVVEPESVLLPRLSILPFVFAVPMATEVFELSPEVAAALWVPLAHFSDASVHVTHRLPVHDAVFNFPGFRVGEGVVWGLTRRILDDLLARIV